MKAIVFRYFFVALAAVLFLIIAFMLKIAFSSVFLRKAHVLIKIKSASSLEVSRHKFFKNNYKYIYKNII